ncbi:MAG: HypC/HybG/HupF family hydrogenase formation chaperone [Polyangiaceae bacterium]
MSISHDTLPMGRVEFGGIVKEVCLAYVPEASVGDFVIVHVGFAIHRIDAEQAERTLADLALLRETPDGAGET